MTQKLLLAEGLDLLRRTEAREYEVDRSQARIGSSDKYRHELSRLRQAYETVYRDYLLGMEIINYVRRCAIDTGDPKSHGLIALCEGKMNAYMNRCELVRKKEDNILLPLDQIDSYGVGDAFVMGSSVLFLNGATSVLTRKEGFSREETLSDGSYLLVVKNLDSYSVAAPRVTIVVDIISSRGQQQRLQKVVPCQCGWRRLIGVVVSATFRLVARTDALVRDSHVDISLHRLEPAPTTVKNDQMKLPGEMAAKLVSQLPKMSDDELNVLINQKVPANHISSVTTTGLQGSGENDAGSSMEELQHLTVPHSQPSACMPLALPERIEVNPADMNCASRLQRLRATLNLWPNDGVMVAPMNKEQQRVVQAVYALPLPNEIDV